MAIPPYAICYRRNLPYKFEMSKAVFSIMANNYYLWKQFFLVIWCFMRASSWYFGTPCPYKSNKSLPSFWNTFSRSISEQRYFTNMRVEWMEVFLSNVLKLKLIETRACFIPLPWRLFWINQFLFSKWNVQNQNKRSHLSETIEPKWNSLKSITKCLAVV